MMDTSSGSKSEDESPRAGPSYHEPVRQSRPRRCLVLGVVAAAAVVLAVAAVAFSASSSSDGSGPSSTGSPLDESAAVAACIREQRARFNPSFPGRGRSPMVGQASKPPPLLLRNAELWSGEGEFKRGGVDILAVDGLVAAVGPGLQAPTEDTTVVEANGRVVTAGMVDMHSHLGVYAWPEVWATEDGNEMTNPTFPQVRAIDAFDPEDWAIPRVLSGGVTTAQVLPGSGNLMGGEGGIFKLRGSSVEDMFVEGSPRLLKHACGENPKRVYGRGRKETPMSRMGSAWLMREKYDAARRVVEAQERWCAGGGGRADGEPFPHDLSLESLVALLRGEARLHVHCYEVHDLAMMVRLADEFGFRVSAFHHALEAYKDPGMLSSRNITAATFADLWGYKKEAYDASTRGPAVLHAAGVAVAIKSDHPVIFAAGLMYEAAKAHHYGLPAQAAIASVTSVAADAIGMGAHVGRVQRGHDADLVVWDRDPLTVGAHPALVFVNGVLHADNGLGDRPAPGPGSADPPAATLEGGCPADATGNLGSYAVVGANVSTGAGSTLVDATVVVTDGVVVCARVDCDVPAGHRRFVLRGGAVVPGLVDAGSGVGQIEIDSEGSTQDGYIPGSGASGSTAAVHAADGLRLGTRHVYAAWAGGVTVSVAHPQGEQLVGGLSTAFYTCQGCGATVRSPGVTLKRTVSLHGAVGNAAKDGDITSSVSGEMEALRELLDAAKAAVAAANATTSDQLDRKDRALGGVVLGELVLGVEANQADVIAALLDVQAEYGLRLVVRGGAEAHVVADLLAATDPPVAVLLDARRAPSDFDSARARADAPVLLDAAGVKVGMYVADPDNGRNLRWEAGMAREAGATHEHALAMVTRNVAEMFGMVDAAGHPLAGVIRENARADFVAFDDDPFSLRSRVQLVASGGYVECQPRQR